MGCMVDRMHCTRCAGMGKLLPRGMKPEQVTPESWQECPRCKGSGVEMTSDDDAFEVYFTFHDEVSAREFADAAYKLIPEGEWMGRWSASRAA